MKTKNGVILKRVTYWGNSLAVRLSRKFYDWLGIGKGTKVEVSRSRTGSRYILVLEPVKEQILVSVRDFSLVVEQFDDQTAVIGRVR